MQKSIMIRSTLVTIFVFLLIWPLALNRTAILYPDTGRYLMNGLNLWHAIDARHTGVRSTSLAGNTAGAIGASQGGPTSVAKPKVTLGGRSPYYGAFAWGARAFGGLGTITIAQALWLALVLVVALPEFGLRRPHTQIVTVAAISMISPLAFFIDVIMPDVFIGVVVVAVFVLWYRWPRTWMPRLWWLFNILAAVLFHTSALLLAVLLLACLALAEHRSWQNRRHQAISIFSALAIGLCGSVAMDLAIKHATGRAVTPIPYLLARTIGDGTAARVLREDCPARGYATCRFVNQFPLTENEFLWGRPGLVGWNQIDPSSETAIVREQWPIVFAALTRYPGQQLSRSAHNLVWMFFTLDVDEFGYSIKLDHSLDNKLFDAQRIEAESGRIYSQHLTLRLLSVIWHITYIVAVSFVIVALLFRRRLRISRLTLQVASTMLLALVLSAAIQGVLGGVWGRYTARIAWLAILAAIVIAVDILRGRTRSLS
ncbi:hypothetical protein KZX46_03535 (plasmid) [Polymorphobacter sp. PAMC 29334]|uniref:hypothetical protein n=1 Tax=Polymorphobacter sp. PAMC 29334 TaxID=2862331 RepID=UPI001C777F95|nr:hypothetical protein [Polymorphobacter sp. PAMC 29334]QYE33193.1 hypothetical protein KZX46_03535 [Polymorphobacter sp. PAMC 29334]